MKSSAPSVSIGLPVFNGEKYLRNAIDSILGQSFADFELIISDNASTDKTADICHDYLLKDNRIRYHRNRINIGASPNYNRTFYLSRGKYFKWASHDDIIAKDYLRECVEVLESNPSIILCHSKHEVIDSRGDIIEGHRISSKNIEKYLHDLNSPDAVLRFRNYIQYDHPCMDIFGVIRSESLRKTELMEDYWGSDRKLLVDLSLRGPFYRVEECLFFNRDHEEQSVKIINKKLVTKWLNTNKAEFIVPIWLRQLFEYLKLVLISQLSAKNKLKCTLLVWKWIIKYQKFLLFDSRTLLRIIWKAVKRRVTTCRRKLIPK